MPTKKIYGGSFFFLERKAPLIQHQWKGKVRWPRKKCRTASGWGPPPAVARRARCGCVGKRTAGARIRETAHVILRTDAAPAAAPNALQQPTARERCWMDGPANVQAARKGDRSYCHPCFSENICYIILAHMEALLDWRKKWEKTKKLKSYIIYAFDL